MLLNFKIIIICLLSILSFTVSSKDRDPFYFRAGFTSLQPDASSSEVNLDNVGDIAQLAISNGPIEDSSVNVEGVDFASIIVGYRLPWFGERFSLETILALPLTIKFTAEGGLANESISPFALGNIPTGIPPLGKEFGETKALPPVVTLVYKVLKNYKIKPYIGGGIAFMYTYDSKVTNAILTEVREPELEIENAMGYVGQAGFEINLTKRWKLNLDAKYIGGLESDATVKGIVVKTPGTPLFETADVGNASVTVKVDPTILSLGLGFDF